MILEWTHPGASRDARPFYLYRNGEQLGLNRESGKAPIDVLVIDRLERPSEN